MWNHFLGLLPKTSVMIYTGLAFLIPFSIYHLNRKMHRYGDPPWKRDEKGVDEDADM